MTNEQQTIKELEKLIANFCESLAIAMPDCNVSINITNVDVRDAEPLIEITNAERQFHCNRSTGATSSNYAGTLILDAHYKNFLHFTSKSIHIIATTA